MATTQKGIPGISNDINWNLNTDWQNTIDAIDALLDGRGTAAQRTAALSGAPQGTMWQDTDGAKMIWRKDGTAWVPAMWRHGGTTTQMNAFTQAPNGFEWFNSTDGCEYMRKDGAWSRMTAPKEALSNIRGGVAVVASVTAEMNAGLVTLSGSFSGNTFTGGYTAIATVPSWAVPVGKNIEIPVGANTTASTAFVVKPDGHLYLWRSTASGAWMNLLATYKPQ